MTNMTNDDSLHRDGEQPQGVMRNIGGKRGDNIFFK